MTMTKYSISDLKRFAITQNGSCLSDKYISIDKKYKWKCNVCNNIWDSSWSNVYHNKTWCRVCGFKKIGDIKRKYSLSDCVKIASKRGGVCLSKEYKNTKLPLLWRCSNGHEWFANFVNVYYNKTWCLQCSGLIKLTLDDAKNLASERGGLCLSDVYVNSATPLLWSCSKGHRWYAKFNNVKNGLTWCPYCHSSVGEKITREYFNRIFNTRFIKCRPSWLITKDGRRLELDGFNDKLKIAFEYQGRQHREDNIFSLKRSLNDVMYCDDEKKKICKKKGIKLFLIDDNVGYCNIAKSIYDQAKYFDLTLYCNIYDINYKMFDIYTSDLNDIKYIVSSKGGILVSDRYISSSSELDVVCGNGHKFSVSSNKLKDGRWCPYCAGRFVNIDSLIKCADDHGGRLLSKRYYNSSYKYRWMCSKGHIWRATWGNIHQGRWCPKCKYKNLWNTRRNNMKSKTTGI